MADSSCRSTTHWSYQLENNRMVCIWYGIRSARQAGLLFLPRIETARRHGRLSHASFSVGAERGYLHLVLCTNMFRIDCGMFQSTVCSRTATGEVACPGACMFRRQVLSSVSASHQSYICHLAIWVSAAGKLPIWSFNSSAACSRWP